MARLRSASRSPIHGAHAEELEGIMVASGGGATNNFIVVNVFNGKPGILTNPEKLGESIGRAILLKLEEHKKHDK